MTETAYEFTDRHGDKLVVRDHAWKTDVIVVGVENDGKNHTAYVPHTKAAELAGAILSIAGIKATIVDHSAPSALALDTAADVHRDADPADLRARAAEILAVADKVEAAQTKEDAKVDALALKLRRAFDHADSTIAELGRNADSWRAVAREALEAAE